MHRYKVVLGYSGSGFFGSQVQVGLRTVEGVFSHVFETLRIPGKIVGFGARTDSGVSASGQTVFIDVDPSVSYLRLLRGFEALLPFDIFLNRLMPVSPCTHPRGSARYREYRYYLTDEKLPFPFRGTVTPVSFKLDIARLNYFANMVLGCHDFGGFENSGSPGKSREKIVVRSDFVQSREASSRFMSSFNLVTYVIVADSFLYRMVRNVVGAILCASSGKLEVGQFLGMLSSGKRTARYLAVPAEGLELHRIYY
ncbi:tRNA pseudouridine synthase A [bacterium]|nr:tRNA pseudouridine synthase A [bacterium]